MRSPLEAFHLFDDLGGDDRLKFEEYLEERCFGDGQSVFLYHDESGEALLVAEGSVRIEREGETRCVLGPGHVLGGVSLVAIGTRECTAIADGPVRLFALNRGAYLRLRSEAPHLALVVQESILRSFAGSVRTLIPQV